MLYNIDMSLRDMLADDRATEIMDRFLPGLRSQLENNPMAGTMSLRQLADYVKGMIPQTALEAINEALKELNDGSLTPAEREKVVCYRAMLEADHEAQQLPKPETGSQRAIYPGRPWLDTSGHRIQAHGGAVFVEDDVYYWYGENKQHTDGESDIWSWGIRCYRSTDLYNWQDMGMIIEPNVEDLNSNLFPDRNVDRPHIVKSAVTGKYVCWIKLSGVSACYAVLEADSILGPYTMVRENYRPFGYEVGDFDLYTDEQSGKSYLFENGDHGGIYGMELSEDCCEAVREISVQYDGLKPPFTREGVAVFEHSGKKYMLTSGMTGYLPNRSDSAATGDWEQPFVSLGDPYVNDETHASFNSQISKVFRIAGTDRFVAIADRWVPDTLLDAALTDKIERVIAFSSMPEKYSVTPEERAEVLAIPAMDDTSVNTSLADYVWLPIRFEGDKPIIEWVDEWTV